MSLWKLNIDLESVGGLGETWGNLRGNFPSISVTHLYPHTHWHNQACNSSCQVSLSSAKSSPPSPLKAHFFNSGPPGSLVSSQIMIQEVWGESRVLLGGLGHGQPGSGTSQLTAAGPGLECRTQGATWWYRCAASVAPRASACLNSVTSLHKWPWPWWEVWALALSSPGNQYPGEPLVMPCNLQATALGKSM